MRHPQGDPAIATVFGRKLPANSPHGGRMPNVTRASESGGEMEVPAGQVNFRGSLPRSKNNVLQPMLHPEMCKKHAIICIHASRELVFSKC